ncbi:hypothetical protein [Actinosynnema sp. NPDC020468]|uniref:hypothetical protein n=1 Tax=Actinosynnema sp. NPDC020468 TaxID=3154488 RepID=UPI0033C534CB
MRRSVVALLVAVGLLAGCAERTALPEPTLSPAVKDTATLVRVLTSRAAEQRSVRFTARTGIPGRVVELTGGLLRTPEGRLLTAREDGVTDLVVTAEAGFSRESGAPWVRHGLAERLQGRSATTSVGLVDEVDPVDVADGLTGGMIVEVGGEALDGVTTRRYTMLVDLRQQAARTPDPDLRGRLLGAYDSGFTGTAVVWVGPGDLPVKVEQTLTTLEDKVFLQTTHTFTDWNSDVRVRAPIS